MKIDLIAQLAVAGGLVGFLIGPQSLDQFIGMFPENTIVMNVVVGTLVGLALGVVASVTSKSESE